MLEGLGVFQYVRRHVDIAAGSRRRQRLVFCPTVEHHQVCEAGENAESRADPVLASSNALAHNPRSASLYVCVCARVGLL